MNPVSVVLVDDHRVVTRSLQVVGIAISGEKTGNSHVYEGVPA